MSFFKKYKVKSDAHLTDEQVVARVLEGETALLDVLYERYSGKIFHKCLSLIKDREAAKDCTHDIIVKVFTNLANFKGRSAFSLWVHSISYNYCMDYLQKRKRTDFSDNIEYELDVLTNDDSELEDKLLHDLQLVQLETVFEKLNTDEKMILMMRYQDNMSVKDISDSLNIGESAVKMRLKRSRDHLGELIVALEKKQNR
jgi:RNA polymerase sigma-70 factor (ECF subfamily)